PVYEAAVSYADAGVALLVIGGREYGTGSSRDWAAKATALLRVRAVLARSFERIHRANLVQLGVLPLEFQPGESAQSLGLDGTEAFDVPGTREARDAGPSSVTTRVTPQAGRPPSPFGAPMRLDTPQEVAYYIEGGLLPYVYRRFLRGDLG